jgi:light-regulated signal transduction histidine kinase (bacteriophytochrome)
MVFLADAVIVCSSIEAMHRYRARYAAELKEARHQEAEAKYQQAHVAVLNKSLDEFTYIAAHDLKEPLRGIHNYASFLKEDCSAKLDDSDRQYIDSIQRLAERLSTLIDSLMNYSRLGATELVKDPVDVDAVVDSVAEDLKRLWTTEGIELRRKGRLGMVKGDAIRIGEVFQNLFSNAAKYNDKSPKWIEVGCDRSSATPVFYVRDNGIGIAPQHHENVFRIFKRLHEQNKYGGGTGAGLTIVRKIVERCGGRIWLESVPEEGTVFYFTLSGEA